MQHQSTFLIPVHRNARCRLPAAEVLTVGWAKTSSGSACTKVCGRPTAVPRIGQCDRLGILAGSTLELRSRGYKLERRIFTDRFEAAVAGVTVVGATRRHHHYRDQSHTKG